MLTADARVLEGAGLDAAARAALRSPDPAAIDRSLEWLQRDGRGAITLGQPAYPALLATLSDAPPVLFTVGDVARLGEPLLAIVGSRNPTRPGSETAADFAASLSGCGLGVASGLALGPLQKLPSGTTFSQGTVAVFTQTQGQVAMATEFLGQSFGPRD